MENAEARWTAIVLAGQRPGPDPLAQAFGEEWKALVRVGGTPMVLRVVRTLLQTPAIARIVVLAQEPSVFLPILPADERLSVAISGSGISASIRNLAGSGSAPWPVLVTTADHPLLTVEMISDFLARVGGSDVAVAMVERQVMLAAYPDNKRTWLKFADGHWSGANLFALCTAATHTALDLWANAEQDRKTAWKLFLHFGPILALRALTRTIGLAKGLEAAGKRLGLNARLLPLAQAEAAIDVDKVADHAQAEAILAKRTRI